MCTKDRPGCPVPENPTEKTMSQPNKLTPGDRVAYAAKFLKDTAQFTGPARQRRGTFVSYWDKDPNTARVHWDDFDHAASAKQWGEDYADDAKAHGQCVLAVNVAKVGVTALCPQRYVRPPLTPKQLLQIIRQLPASMPIADRVPARQPHKPHWIGWVSEYNGPGYYGRSNWDRDAEYIYNHLHSAGMLIWINEAAGVSHAQVLRAWDAARPLVRAGSDRPGAAGIIRAWLPWRNLETKLTERCKC